MKNKMLIKFMSVLLIGGIAVFGGMKMAKADVKVYSSFIHINSGYSLYGSIRNYPYDMHSIRFYNSNMRLGESSRLEFQLRNGNYAVTTTLATGYQNVWKTVDSTYPLGNKGKGDRYYYFTLSHSGKDWPGIDYLSVDAQNYTNY